MLQLELLPAGPGDCIWLEYGDPGRTHIILMDGGVKDTFEPLEQRIGQALKEREASKLHIDLLVVTHIDNDHIDGILKLLDQTQHEIDFGDIWFNGNCQLVNLPPSPEDKRGDLLGNLEEIPRPDLLGLKEGDQLSVLLSSHQLPWNRAFLGAAAMVPIQGKLASWDCDGGLNLTLLGPPLLRLRKLAEKWKQVIQGEPEEERPDLLGRRDTWPPVWREELSTDNSVANGSSIVLLAEYGGRSLLLTGDAYAEDIEAALTRLQVERNQAGTPSPLTALKLPHHGSARNISKNLLERVKCDQYLISTDGSGNPRHPDHQALLRVLKYSSSRPCMAFNYDSDTTRDWRDFRRDVVKLGLGNYDTLYAQDPDRGLVLDLHHSI
jgi:hypothetical protein